MLAQLVESSPRRVRRRFSTLLSLAAHAVVLTAAVAAARPVADEPTDEGVITWHPPPPPPPADCTNCPSRLRGGADERLAPPDVVIPELTLSGPTVDLQITVEWPLPIGLLPPGEPWTRSTTGGHQADTASVHAGTAVDREVVPLATNPGPTYPEALRTARIEGSVRVRFVVDTTGRVLMESVIVDVADHPLFATAVIDALKRARYRPAELGGRKVRQLVAQPFVFVIRE